jgi:GNAT superfamily N-acetyltransferase
MKITLREDVHPEIDFYYYQQFKIYQEPYLLWDRETWKGVLLACKVFRIEVDGKVAGDVILEESRKGILSIVDFGLLPEYQGRGIGKEVLQKVKEMGKNLSAVTRKETLPFFLKSGFVLKKKMEDYYDLGADGYSIIFNGKRLEK